MSKQSDSIHLVSKSSVASDRGPTIRSMSGANSGATINIAPQFRSKLLKLVAYTTLIIRNDVLRKLSGVTFNSY